MSKINLVAQAGLVFAALATATAFATPSFAEEVSASSGASGTVSANSSITGPPASATSQGNVSFGTGSQTTENAKGEGAASSNSQAAASAGATAGGGSISLTLTSGAETGVSSADGTKNAVAGADASGSIGPAHLGVQAHAEATSGPGQMTASANASDGSFALAEKGSVNGLKTFVPGGVTKLLQNNSDFESISCNAGGTCSQARVTNDFVSAGIRIFANTDTVTAGNVNAILSAFLSVEASAGWSGVAAVASSNISGSGISNGTGYSASVSANIGTSGSSGIWRVTSVDNGNAGAISAKVWLQGKKICASTKVHSKRSQDGLKTIVKCRSFTKNKNYQRIVLTQQSHKNWLTKIFDSRFALRN